LEQDGLGSGGIRPQRGPLMPVVNANRGMIGVGDFAEIALSMASVGRGHTHCSNVSPGRWRSSDDERRYCMMKDFAARS